MATIVPSYLCMRQGHWILLAKYALSHWIQLLGLGSCMGKERALESVVRDLKISLSGGLSLLWLVSLQRCTSWSTSAVKADNLTLSHSLFSFLPPSTTIRRYQRRMMATTVAELGGAYCEIVSFANTHRQEETEKSLIMQSLIAVRLKLKRSLVLKTNVVYEVSGDGGRNCISLNGCI